MRRDPTFKSATLLGASDLTIVAPIKAGFVPALDSVTYKTRVTRVLKALHLGRTASHEYDFARALSDAVERVGRIHSIRIAVLEPENRVVLAVTFDGSWESYIRVVWQKVARSLDLVFCNTEGYVTGWDHSFEQWCDWLRSAQAEAPFLYSPPGLTYQDTQYLRAFERRWRRANDPAEADVDTARFRVVAAEEITDRIRRRGIDPGNLGAETPLDLQQASRPAFQQGLRGLASLYRLADVYLPGTPDGRVLHRAAVELLREFMQMVGDERSDEYQAAIAFAETRFRHALDWLRHTPQDERPVPALPPQAEQAAFADAQGGIVRPYAGVAQGGVFLVAFDSRQALGDFLAGVAVTTAGDTPVPGRIALNVSLTLEGLRLAGLTDDEVEALPGEFVQGMERRAGPLGDVRANHPRRWRLPVLNAGAGVAAQDARERDPGARVELAGVHAVLDLRLCGPANGDAGREALWEQFRHSTASHPGLRLLSVQWMHTLPTAEGREREHFGYVHTGFGPVFDAAERGRRYANQAPLGEVLLGHDNFADFAPAADGRDWRRRLLHNGSFLVLRKLRQDVPAFRRVVEAGVDAILAAEGGAADRAALRQLVMARMMGRWPADAGARAGRPLAGAADGDPDDHTYLTDKTGAGCPFHAHVRLANPREAASVYFTPAGVRPPRLVRRGMSYGPLHDPADPASDAAERGMVFLAYNASIGEQFEVVQGWLTAGNGSGGYSGHADPFLAVPEPARPRVFRFEHEGRPYRIPLDATDRLDDEPEPLVRLEWGLYAFTPSVPALRLLADRALANAGKLVKSWCPERGEREIARLRALEQTQGAEPARVAWKAVLEDPTAAAEFTTASVWAAIRERHDGVLKTPYGVLVASRERVDEMLHDRPGHLTVAGYLPRMERSFGALYLGLDPHPGGAYEAESAPVNAAVMALTGTRDAFTSAVREAREVTISLIEALRAHALAQAREDQQPRWELTFELREVTDQLLAHFCERWFGLGEQGGHFERSGIRWQWQPGEPACYPGHFSAPSRWTFWPHPGPEVERVGAEHGQAVRAAMQAYLDQFGEGLTAPIARIILDLPLARSDPGYAARTLAGMLMGFVPTTDANLRRVADEWLREGTLWRLRHQALAGEAPEVMERQVRAAFVPAMQLRAAPDLLWRTAARSHAIGSVQVQPGDIVVASLLSSTQQSLEVGDPSLDHAYGGRRSATQPHPVHACPGQGPSMAVMLGFFSGLVAYRGPLRPGPAPLTLSLRGFLEDAA